LRKTTFRGKTGRTKAKTERQPMKFAETVTFGGAGIDRADHLRNDADALAAIRSDGQTRAVVFWRGKPMVELDGTALARVGMDHFILQHAKEDPVFLGLVAGTAVFGFDISSWEPVDIDPQALGQFFDPSVNRHPDLPDTVGFAEVRGIMAGLSREDAELVASALGVLNWHRSHRFCAKCGSRSAMHSAGWMRKCPDCDTSHFPRTDPVVIMLITHNEDVLLGRSPHWPEGMYSLLAGFMEPGESIEAAVRREIFEESGIRIGPVSYLASQPWPFPSSLMIGCAGTALTRDITLDEQELEDAKWVSKESLIDAMTGKVQGMNPARKGSIARFLIDHWLADTLG
jgi:NAD+ diphosphatase